MEFNINIHKFLEKFSNNYEYLYNNEGIFDYSEYVNAFDDFVKIHRDFVGEFAEYRKDYISSDREAAAFMLTLEEMIQK